VDGWIAGVVRSPRVPLDHGHVRLLARPGRAVRATHSAAVRQHSQHCAWHRTPDSHVRPDLQRVPRSPVRRHVPDAHAAFVGVRPGAGKPSADR